MLRIANMGYSSNRYEGTPVFGDLEETRNKNDSIEVTDDDILSLATSDGFPMTSFQLENFVIGDAITDYRKRRQALLEIEVRRQALYTILKGKRKALAELAILERDIDKESDKLVRDLLECEADDYRYDIEVYETKEPQARKEVQAFIDHLRKLLPENATIKQFDKRLNYDENLQHTFEPKAKSEAV